MMKQHLGGQDYYYKQTLEDVTYRDISEKSVPDPEIPVQTFTETVEYCDYIRNQVKRETLWLNTTKDYLKNWSKIIEPCEGEFDETDFRDYKLNFQYKILTEQSLANAKNTLSSLQSCLNILVIKPCIDVCDSIKKVIEIDNNTMRYIDPKIDQVLDNLEINNRIRTIKSQNFQNRTLH